MSRRRGGISATRTPSLRPAQKMTESPTRMPARPAATMTSSPRSWIMAPKLASSRSLPSQASTPPVTSTTSSGRGRPKPHRTSTPKTAKYPTTEAVAGEHVDELLKHRARILAANPAGVQP